jgi:DNA-binding NtrC family response regulator
VRVLLAEDEENLGALLEAFLGGRGHAVRRVRDGRAAVDALRAEPFDVALVDVMMPELDGLDVLRAMGGLAQRPEAIVVTGSATVDVALSAMQLGAFDYLTKPYRMADVEALVRRAAERGGLRREASLLRRRLAQLEPPAVFVTHDPRLRAVLDAGADGFGDDVVLVTGVPGGGRRTLARWLHARGPRRLHPVLDVACTGDAERDARALFAGGDAGAAGDGETAGEGALVAAAASAVVVRDVERLAPPLGERLAAAAGDGARLLLTGRSAPAWADAAAARRVAIPPLGLRPVDVRPLAEHLAGSALDGRVVRLGAAALDWLAGRAWSGDAAELRLVLELAARRADRGAADVPLDVAALAAACGSPPPGRFPSPERRDG